jgi:basic amino acid/polyamine antiporter, APA family
MVIVLTGVVLAGIRLSSRVNIVIVCTTLFSLLAFMVAGVPHVSISRLAMRFEPIKLLHAAALMFVAFTGYGRIATLGEEVLDPYRTIPRAITTTLIVSMLLYVGVAIVGVGAAGVESFETAATENAASLEIVSRRFHLPVHGVVAIGAMTAMLGVLLNLLLGLSRVLLAMGRRGDMPAKTANLNVSIIVIGILIAALAATGSVRVTWSFSAFTALIYYAVTNLAAHRLSDEERLYRRVWALIGLVACLALAFAIEWQVWATGLAILSAGLIWRHFRLRRTAESR